MLVSFHHPAVLRCGPIPVSLEVGRGGSEAQGHVNSVSDGTVRKIRNGHTSIKLFVIILIHLGINFETVST